jgi:hypothetical protein
MERTGADGERQLIAWCDRRSGRQPHHVLSAGQREVGNCLVPHVLDNIEHDRA